MSQLEDCGQRGRGDWNKDAGAAQDEAIHHSPWRVAISNHRVAEGAKRVVHLELMAAVIVEPKRRPGERAEGGIVVPVARQCIGDSVEVARTTFDIEVIAE